MDEATLFQEIEARWDNGDYLSAIEILESHDGLRSDRIAYARVICLCELSRRGEAIALAEASLHEWPESVFSFAAKSRVALERGEYPVAREMAEKASLADPTNPVSLYALSECEFTFGEPWRSLELSRTLVEVSGRPSDWARLSSIANMIAPDYDAAVHESFERRHPTAYARHTRLGWRALLWRRFEEAREIGHRTHEMSTRALSPMLLLAFAYQGLGDLDQASQWNTKALQISPGDLVGLQLALILARRQNDEPAVRGLEAKLKVVDPLFTDREAIKAIVDNVCKYGPEKTVQLLEPFLGHPNNLLSVKAADGMFDRLAALQQWDRAEAVLMRRLRIDVTGIEVALRRMRLLIHRNQLGEALKVCEEAQSQTPDSWQLRCFHYEILARMQWPQAISEGRALIAAEKKSEVEFIQLATALFGAGQGFNAVQVMREALQNYPESEPVSRVYLYALAFDGRLIQAFLHARRMGWTPQGRKYVKQAFRKSVFDLPKRPPVKRL